MGRVHSGLVTRSAHQPYRPILERLEERKLLSVSLFGGTLQVNGTEGADLVKLHVDDGNLVVKVVNASGEKEHVIDPSAAIDRIQINTGAGNDRVIISSNVDEWLARAGNVGVTLDVDTGAGNDRVILGGRLDLDAWIDAGAGNDRVKGGAGDDHIEGGRGNDFLHGGSGDDEIMGGAGRDRIRGGAGDDELHGNGGADFLWGMAGSDVLLGYMGNDRLFGAGGFDMLLGQQGRDLLHGGAGQDWTDGDVGDRQRAVEHEVEFETVLTALLNDPISGAWGRADFSLELGMEEGEFSLEARLEIEFFGDPNRVYPVYIDGELIGYLSTDSSGYAWSEFYFELGVEHEQDDADSEEPWDDDYDADDEDWHDEEPEMDDDSGPSGWMEGNINPAQLRLFRPGATLSVGDASGELFLSYFEASWD